VDDFILFFETSLKAIEVEEESPVTRCYQMIAEGLSVTLFTCSPSLPE
jgi:hypothetical protein